MSCSVHFIVCPHATIWTLPSLYGWCNLVVWRGMFRNALLSFVTMRSLSCILWHCMSLAYASANALLDLASLNLHRQQNQLSTSR